MSSLCSCTPGLRVQSRPFAPRSPPYLLWVPVMRLEEGQEATCPTWDLAKPPWAPVPPNFLSSRPGKHVRFDGNPAPPNQRQRQRRRGMARQTQHDSCGVMGGRRCSGCGLGFAVGQRGSNPLMNSWATAGRNSSHFTSIQSSNKSSRSACHGPVRCRR